jgi:hypothetical protein
MPRATILPLHSGQVPDAFSDHALQFPAYTATIFLLRARHMQHGANTVFAALPVHQSADDCLAVDPVRPGSVVPPGYRDRGGVDHMAFDARGDQCAVPPDTVEPTS